MDELLTEEEQQAAIGLIFDLRRALADMHNMGRSIAPCMAQGDQTWCHELRGNRAPKDVRGLPLPKQFWCAPCKTREKMQQLLKDIDNG